MQSATVLRWVMGPAVAINQVKRCFTLRLIANGGVVKGGPPDRKKVLQEITTTRVKVRGDVFTLVWDFSRLGLLYSFPSVDHHPKRTKSIYCREPLVDWGAICISADRFRCDLLGTVSIKRRGKWSINRTNVPNEGPIYPVVLLQGGRSLLRYKRPHSWFYIIQFFTLLHLWQC